MNGSFITRKQDHERIDVVHFCPVDDFFITGCGNSKQTDVTSESSSAAMKEATTSPMSAENVSTGSVEKSANSKILIIYFSRVGINVVSVIKGILEEIRDRPETAIANLGIGTVVHVPLQDKEIILSLSKDCMINDKTGRNYIEKPFMSEYMNA